MNPSTGGAVCATSHLTDFAMVTDVLTSPDAFFESFVDLNVNRTLNSPQLLELAVSDHHMHLYSWHHSTFNHKNNQSLLFPHFPFKGSV